MKHHDAAATLRFGAPLSRARLALVLLHGRGSSAEDIAGLGESLDVKDCAFLAPSAQTGSWYPQRFFAPLEQNEPWLTSALGIVDKLVREAFESGVTSERVGLIGFSQGGCLALEYSARHPRRYAFVAGLSAALIGPLDVGRLPGDLKRTPTLLGCSERDAHIPLEFVENSVVQFGRLGADVSKQIYPGSAHTVFPNEIEWLNGRLLHAEKSGVHSRKNQAI